MEVVTVLRLFVLVLAVLTSYGVLCVLFGAAHLPPWAAAVASLALAALAWTPFGDLYALTVLRARRPLPQEEACLHPALSRVAAACGVPEPRAHVSGLTGVNAWAVGTGHVVVARDVLALPVQELEAVLAHELGHLKQGDGRWRAATWACAAAASGGLQVLAVVMRVFPIGFFHAIGDLAMSGAAAVDGIFAALLAWVSRRQEYAADAFAAAHGFGAGLAALFRFAPAGQQGLLASHPDPLKRVERLTKGGA